VTVDVSARPHWSTTPSREQKVGTFDVELVEEFLRAFAQSSGVCLHVNVAYGSKAHHTVEAVFKRRARLSAAVDSIRGQGRSLHEGSSRVRGSAS